MFSSFMRRGKSAPVTSPSPQSINLTDRQLILLSKAAARDDGLALPPDGMAREEFESAFGPLVRLGLVARDEGRGEDAFRITVAGLAAICISDEEQDGSAAKADTHIDPVPSRQGKAAIRNMATPSARTRSTGSARLEPGTAPSVGRTPALVALLQRADGVRLDEIQQAFGWKPHTARAALSRLRSAGHVPIREMRGDGGLHIYRLHVAKEDSQS